MNGDIDPEKLAVQMEGRRAYSQGRPKEANPYDSTQEKIKHAYWNAGWTHAKAMGR